jgi:hypothetical protein
MTQKRNKITKIQKSKGHIGFTKTHEYFRAGDIIYRAQISDYIGTDGYRAGARFESTPAAFIRIGAKIEWVKES